MANVAQTYMLRDDEPTAIAWADRAIELADRLDLPAARTAALIEKGSAMTAVPEHVVTGRELLTKAADEAEKTGEWLLAARALNNLLTSSYPPALGEKREMLERMRAAAARAGFEALAVAAYYEGRAHIAISDGDLAAATAAIDEARRRDQGTLRTSRGSDYHGVFRAGLALEAGDLDLAEVITRSLTAEPRAASQLPIAGLQFHVACRRGDPAAALVALREVLERAALSKPWSEIMHDLVSAGLAAGLPVPTLRPLHEMSVRTPEGWYLLTGAQLDEAEGRTEEALAGYVAAADGTDLPPAPRGTALVGAARCLLALGRTGEAARRLADAEHALARWGGWRVAELVGLRCRAKPGSGVDAVLTARELEVAWLVADGLTNAELARKLTISPRTAAVHVSNILTKLSLSSRTQVAERLRSATD
jgi:DNA-binding CsgD family transcriptional regulator